MVPGRVLQISRWPRTAAGKIDRKALPAPGASAVLGHLAAEVQHGETALSVFDGGEHEVDAPLDRMPLYQRAGSVIALAHPDLMTAVAAADETVADPDQVGDAIELKTSPGPADRLVLADGSVLNQEPFEDGLRVLVEQPLDRKVLIHLQFDTNYQGQPDAFIGGQPQGLVSVESDPWSCESPCYRVDGSQLIVVLQGRKLEVRP